jgi:hypothetical protein
MNSLLSLGLLLRLTIFSSSLRDLEDVTLRVCVAMAVCPLDRRRNLDGWLSGTSARE